MGEYGMSTGKIPGSQLQKLWHKLGSRQMGIFVDGDDVVDAEMIRMLIPEDSTIQIIGAMMLENDNGEVLRANSFDHVQGYPEITFSKSLTGEFYMPQRCSSLPCARAYNAEIIRRHNIRFDERVAYGEDLLFNLEYLRHISLIQLTTMPLYHYIKHGNSNSSSRYLNGMAASIDIIAEAAQSFCAHLGIGKDGFRKYCAEDIMYLGLKAISNEFLSEDKHGRYRRVNAILRNTHFRDATRIALRHSTVSGLLKPLCALDGHRPYTHSIGLHIIKSSQNNHNHYEECKSDKNYESNTSYPFLPLFP